MERRLTLHGGSGYTARSVGLTPCDGATLGRFGALANGGGRGSGSHGRCFFWDAIMQKCTLREEKCMESLACVEKSPYLCMSNKKWKVESGKWKVESGEWKVLPFGQAQAEFRLGVGGSSAVA